MSTEWNVEVKLEELQLLDLVQEYQAADRTWKQTGGGIPFTVWRVDLPDRTVRSVRNGAMFHIGSSYLAVRALRKEREELTISPRDLKQDDLITAYQYSDKSWTTASPAPLFDWIYSYADGDRARNPDGSCIIYFSEHPAVKVMRVKADAGGKVASGSRWNGRCPRCKGNIYVGFTAVEHEGSCR